MTKFLSKDGKFYMRDGKLLHPANILEVPIVTSSLTYNGTAQSPTIYGYNENTMTMGGVTSGTDIGTYHITFTPKSGYEWSDGTSETKTISWSIAKAPRNARVITSSPIVINTNSTEVVVKIDGIYTTPVDPVVSNSQVATATFIGFMQGLARIKVIKVGPGTCTVTVNAAETTNYLATSCSFDVACYATVEVPSQSGALTYTGSAQSPTWNNYNSTSLTVGGTTSSTNAGTYTATFTPIAPYATWTDGSSDTKNVNWTIERAAGSLSLSTNSLTIDANSTTGSFTVTRAGDGAISASSNNTGVATVSVSGNTITVTKVGQGSATITVSVAEGTNHTAPASKTCTVTTYFKTTASTAATSGVNYTSGLPTDWNIMKEIGMAISEASDSINANTTGSVYVNKGNMWAYKITPGDTINVNNNTYAVMGFNNFALTNQNNYGGTHTTAGLTFGMVDCVREYRMNSSSSNSGGWGACLMRTSRMPTLQSGMSDTLAQVKVPYVDYDNQSTILYSDDYLFLPAEKEV